MARIVAILAALAAAGLLGWTWYQGTRSDEFAMCNGNAVGGGNIGGPVSLVDETGKAVTEADLFKEPALVYFGYTFCPDVCPLDNARNAEALDILTEKGFALSSYFVSVDPERDTPEHMAEYTDLVHPGLVGLTGTLDQVKAAANAYKVVFRKQEDGGEYYLVDHTTFTYLMLPGGKFVDFFKRDDTAETIATRTACYLEASKG